MSANLIPVRFSSLLTLLAAVLVCGNSPRALAEDYPVTAPPSELKLNEFYQKYCSASGYPVVSSKRVSDYALKEAAWLIDQMLANRPDVRRAMIASGSRMIVMAHNEFTTDIPEYAHMTPRLFWNARARGLGGSRTDPVCSCAEENVLAYEGDPYSTENILIHEFAHNIHLRGMVNVDPTFDDRLRDTYRDAVRRGLWFGKYASTNKNEYFAEGVQSWFNNNRQPDHDHNHVDTRRELIEYDPGLAKLCREVFGDTELQYTKPTTRLVGHLRGYDPAAAPKFEWPEELSAEKKRIREEAARRGETRRRKEDTHERRTIEGWPVLIDRRLLAADHQTGAVAVRMLTNQLFSIASRLPALRVQEMRRITIRLDANHALENLQYHPNKKWLSDHGYDVALTKQVHIPNAGRLVELLRTNAQPDVVLHELSHGWHDQIIGFGDPSIREGYRSFVESRRFDKVLHMSGRQRRHYALTNHKEYFAEMTEAWFGTNDFYPFVRPEVIEAVPETAALMRSVWDRPEPYEGEDSQDARERDEVPSPNCGAATSTRVDLGDG